jgi:hypothetical protein
MTMEEVIFVVEESPGGGFIAKGLGISIYTELILWKNCTLQ